MINTSFGSNVYVTLRPYPISALLYLLSPITTLPNTGFRSSGTPSNLSYVTVISFFTLEGLRRETIPLFPFHAEYPYGSPLAGDPPNILDFCNISKLSSIQFAASALICHLLSSNIDGL